MSTAVIQQPQAIKRKKEQGGLFRVLAGVHLDQGPPGCECVDCERTKGRRHSYRARGPKDPEDYTGDLVQSERDLVARHNGRGPDTWKFERVTDNPQVTAPAPYPLEKMTKRMLLSIIQDEEIEAKGIDLDKASREQLIQLIREQG